MHILNRMVDKGNRLHDTENVIDLVGGGVLVLLGIVAGVNGVPVLALVLVGLGAAILIYGIVKRQKLSRSPQTPTTSETQTLPEPPDTV